MAPSPAAGAIGPIALTMGDPAGIGLEIALKAWADRAAQHIPAFALYGDPAALRETARRLAIDAPIGVIDTPAAALQQFATVLPVVPIALALPATPGRPDSANGGATIASIDAATAAVIRGEASAIVTNPIAKSVLYAAGFKHPGHTEYLAALADRAWPAAAPHVPVMMLASAELRVVPLTVHVPLADVPRLITGASIIATTRITYQAVQRDFAIPHPRIAVAGLNPHAGEGGSIGREDRDVIAPAIAALRAEGLDVSGPHSADTLFHAAARRGYDAVVCMYHDQALIPIKTLAFDSGVNVTLGLPFIRTSPDHGTAFDIASRGRASPASLIQALRLAANLAHRRAGGGSQSS